MTLREAIATLGQHGAAKLVKAPRSTIQAWHDNDAAPRWRAGDVRKIMRAAERASAAQRDKAAA